MRTDAQIVVIGAGPAGLTAAYELSRHGRRGVVIEADEQVGGLARTVVRDGYRFDIGGHRFFSKSEEICSLWAEMLGEPMLTRPRLSRIYYGGKFYDYPLNARNALRNMGIWTTGLCMLSYARAKAFPVRAPANYEQWVVNQFGRRLYETFFRSYTEKVWGIPCTQIGADWAAQRIKGLDLSKAVCTALFGRRNGHMIRTLIDRFQYPTLGPGQLWERCEGTLRARGWDVRLGCRAVGMEREGARITAVRVRDRGGAEQRIVAEHVLSSMPLREAIEQVQPDAPGQVRAAARRLSYRDFLTVVLVVDAAEVFPDNWIYIHSPDVRVGRIQNFKNWSPAMVPDAGKTSLGMEYFVNEGDELWRSEDEQLVSLSYGELERIGLATGRPVGGYVVRMPKAYPVYDTGYAERLRAVRDWLGGVENLQCIGRNGQHRYNNQDHSMMTALIAARNVLFGLGVDSWTVNEDAEYHEVQAGSR